MFGKTFSTKFAAKHKAHDRHGYRAAVVAAVVFSAGSAAGQVSDLPLFADDLKSSERYYTTDHKRSTTQKFRYDFAGTSKPRPGRRPAAGKRAPRPMSKEVCLRRLKGTIERKGLRPDRATYARARRYCARGDLRSAIRVINRASRAGTHPPRGDRLSGGPGEDRIVGEAGDDEPIGGDGSDDLSGGDGNVASDGGPGEDTSDGGPEEDIFDAGPEEDTFDGNPGKGAIDDGEDTSTIGGAFENLIKGSLDRLNDRLNGGRDRDRIVGKAGDDEPIGGDGSDDLSGDDGNVASDDGPGEDTSGSGPEEDTFDGGPGEDAIDGGDGGHNVTPGGDEEERPHLRRHKQPRRLGVPLHRPNLSRPTGKNHHRQRR